MGKNLWICCDAESDGPTPPLYSMVCFGAVIVEPGLLRTFYGKTSPISNEWIAGSLAVSGFSREEHEKFPKPFDTMMEFYNWIIENCGSEKPIFVSDNNGYDFSFFNYYFHKYVGKNPFGWSSRRIGDLYCGLVKDSRAQWKHLRITNHSHHPVEDAKGNAEVILHMQKEMGLKIDLK